MYMHFSAGIITAANQCTLFIFIGTAKATACCMSSSVQSLMKQSKKLSSKGLPKANGLYIVHIHINGFVPEGVGLYFWKHSRNPSIAYPMIHWVPASDSKSSYDITICLETGEK